MANETETICDGCGKPVAGCAYASIGGSWEPYIPAKVYHLGCVPAVHADKYEYAHCVEPNCGKPGTFIAEREERLSCIYNAAGAARGEDVPEPIWGRGRALLFYCEEHGQARAVGADDYDFQLCEVCMSCDPKPATFVVNRDGVNHYYCEEHGTTLNLSRGIPMNHAEPESRCKDCQAPLETGTVCADCVLRDNARLIKGFAEDPAVVEMLAKEGFKLDFDEINRLLDKSGLMPYSPKAAPKAFSYVPKRFSVEWFKQHVDHFIISFMVGVPLLVVNAIASNIITHHAAQILRAFRIPATIMHWIGY